jgi:hypothetical protein
MQSIRISNESTFKKTLAARLQREYIFNFAYFGGNFFWPELTHFYFT